jgi:hypothetical protein
MKLPVRWGKCADREGDYVEKKFIEVKIKKAPVFDLFRFSL